MNALHWVDCTMDAHGQAILDIFNHAIVHTTALFDLKPRSELDMLQWFTIKEDKNWPVLGLEDEAGQLRAFATYGAFRAHAAYGQTMEHSVYVHPDHQGQGLGRAVLSRLMDHAWQHDVHVLVGVIESGNTASIALHRKLGFVHSGTLREVGRKFDRWLDVDLYQHNRP
jgi:L-amino acid N-acyltransferase